MSDEKNILEKAQRANLANILKKLQAGKTLTPTEKKALDQSQEGEQILPPSGWQRIDDLARTLGITARAINKNLVFKSDERGFYKFPDSILAYIGKIKQKKKPEVDLKTKELELKCKKLEQHLDENRATIIEEEKMVMFEFVNEILRVMKKELDPLLHPDASEKFNEIIKRTAEKLDE